MFGSALSCSENRMSNEPSAKRLKSRCAHTPSRTCTAAMCRSCCRQRSDVCDRHKAAFCLCKTCYKRKTTPNCTLQLCKRCCTDRPLNAKLCEVHRWPPDLDHLPGRPDFSKTNIVGLLARRAVGQRIPRHVLWTVERVENKEAMCGVQGCNTALEVQYTTAGWGAEFDRVLTDRGAQCGKCKHIVCSKHCFMMLDSRSILTITGYRCTDCVEQEDN